ncbi:MAG: hypothetical protein PWP03_188 [Candidatus Woesearchaeota archaeon]|nr:hypothetical protein [Candidatus Woesearchaeota archaeon]MDN5327550.1 hypothetical protein [Candidatus Woesearchaeota archaeon]
MSKNRKAAIQITTGAMVTIILSLVIIGLMIPFLNKFSQKSISFIDTNQEKINEFFMASNCRESEDFCIFPNVIENLNKKTTISGIVVNEMDLAATFKINYTIISLSGTTDKCVNILPPQNYEFNLTPGSKIKLNLVLKPEGSGECLIKTNTFYKSKDAWMPYRSYNIYVYKNKV